MNLLIFFQLSLHLFADWAYTCTLNAFFLLLKGYCNNVKSALDKISRLLFHHSTWKGYWEPIVQRVLPAWRDGFYRARVINTKYLTSDALEVNLLPEKRWRIHRAGQHIALTIDINGKLTTRIFTVASGTNKRKTKQEIRLVVRIKEQGALTPHLHALNKGQWVNISAPMGDFTMPQAEAVLMIAGGSGITPFIAMLEDYAQMQEQAGMSLPSIDVLYYAKPNDHLLVDELNYYAKQIAQVNVKLLSRSNDGDIEPYLAHHGSSHWMVCGPNSLYQQVSRNAEIIDVALSSEHFMAAPLPAETDGDAIAHFTVQHNNNTISVDNKQSLLTQLQHADIPVTYGCGMGICHQCQCMKKSGVVRDTRTGEYSDNAEQLIQLCVSQAITDLELQA